MHRKHELARTKSLTWLIYIYIEFYRGRVQAASLSYSNNITFHKMVEIVFKTFHDQVIILIFLILLLFT